MLKRTLRVLVAAALAATGSTVLAPQPASAGTITNLVSWIGGYLNGAVVDRSHQHLFVSAGSGEIVVTDFIGQLVKRIDGLQSVAGLALSADSNLLYAAVPTADKIVAIDAATLAPVATYPLGDRVAPQQIVRSGDKLWFGYLEDATVSPSPAGLGSLDLADPGHAVTTWKQLDGQDVRLPPLLAANPADPGSLALVDPGRGPNVVHLVDVSTGTPVLVASHDAARDVQNLVFTADGTRLLEDGGNQTAEELSAADLSMIEEYPAGPSPTGVAMADDGTIAVGNRAGDASTIPVPDVTFYRPGSTTPIKTLSLYKTGFYYENDAVRFLTFEPGTDRVITLAAGAAQIFSQQLLNDERPKATTTLTVKITPTVLNQQLFSITGTVTKTVDGVTSPAAGVAVEIDNTNSSGHGGLRAGATTGPGGTYRTNDILDVSDTYVYTARVAEDLVHGPATATATVQSINGTTLTLDHNNSAYNYGSTVTFTAHLGNTYANRTVAIWADPAGSDQGNRLLRSAPVDAKGNVAAALKLSRDTTVSAVFAGDAQTQPLTVRSTVLVRATVSTALTRQYKTKSSVAYFHQKTNPLVTTTMNAFPKRQQYLTVEYYSGGKWHLVKSGFYTLNSAGKSYVTFTNARKLNVKYRVRAAYLVSKSGDSGNLTAYGTYQYLIFTK